jgi:hypothetical protein
VKALHLVGRAANLNRSEPQVLWVLDRLIGGFLERVRGFLYWGFLEQLLADYQSLYVAITEARGYTYATDLNT